jgi:hypothetical protein
MRPVGEGLRFGTLYALAIALGVEVAGPAALRRRCPRVGRRKCNLDTAGAARVTGEARSAANGDYGVWSRGDRALLHAWLDRGLAEEFIANDPEECVLVIFNGSEWVDV